MNNLIKGLLFHTFGMFFLAILLMVGVHTKDLNMSGFYIALSMILLCIFIGMYYLEKVAKELMNHI